MKINYTMKPQEKILYAEVFISSTKWLITPCKQFFSNDVYCDIYRLDILPYSQMPGILPSYPVYKVMACDNSEFQRMYNLPSIEEFKQQHPLNEIIR